jgi:mRNA-degrading endonuclease RelE of RelBE toxin-antitoxin system
MISHTTADFRRDFRELPPVIQKQARLAFRLFLADPQHPSLKFKKLPPHEDLWSARITADYRAIGRWRGDTIVWFFIGAHADDDKLLDRL